MQRESKAEEKNKRVLKASELQHPTLIDNRIREHRESVLECSLYNPSNEVAVIEDIEMFIGGQKVDVLWSNEIDAVGNVKKSNRFIEVRGVEVIFIRERQSDDTIKKCTIRIIHSFPGERIELKYNP